MTVTLPLFCTGTTTAFDCPGDMALIANAVEKLAGLVSEPSSRRSMVPEANVPPVRVAESVQ